MIQSPEEQDPTDESESLVNLTVNQSPIQISGQKLLYCLKKKKFNEVVPLVKLKLCCKL